MTWPLSQDYNEAIQDPDSSLSDPELRAGSATTNALGMPMPRSGNFADVYEFNCPKTKWALKCFTRQVSGLRERYSEISKALHDAKLPFAVEFQYLEKGIRIRGDWYPMLKMRWVEGLLLNEFVRNNLDKPVLLGQLGLIWARMAKRLREANFAHADLQHGNVLLVPGSKNSSLAVKLIDYDGMFVPALAKTKSGEVGHPNYQHPQRLREGLYNAEVDRFPLLVVATALRAISVGGKELWERYDNGDNLLFKETDLQAPAKSKLFKELQGLDDPQTKMLVEELKQSVERKLDGVPTLETLLPETKPASVKSATAVKAGEAPARPVTAAAAVEKELPHEADEPLDFEEPGTREGRSKPHDARSASSVPWWALAAGGGVLALLFFVMAAVGIAWFVMGRTKEPAPIAQKKGSAGPIQDGKGKPVVKDKDSKEKALTKQTVLQVKDPPVPPPPEPPALADDQGFVSLFNGKDLTGWVPQPILPPGKWRVQNGNLVGEGPNMGFLFSQRGDYRDFRLHVEARFTVRGKNGISPGVWVRASTENEKLYGIDVFVNGPQQNTGNIYMRMKNAAVPKGFPVTILPDEWFNLDIIAAGNRVITKVNGKIATDFVDPNSTFMNGHIFLRHGANTQIEIRKIAIKELKAEPAPPEPPPVVADAKGFVPLFNGKNLAGWKPLPQQRGNWVVENGLIINRGVGTAFLMTERGDYKDFHFIMETRVPRPTDCGVVFRYTRPQFHEGYESTFANNQTGMVSARARTEPNGLRFESFGKAAKGPFGEWITTEVIAEGNRIRVKINGETTTDFVDDKFNFRSGYIGLRDSNHAIEFRKVLIKELNAEPAPPEPPAVVEDKGFVPLFNGKDLTGWKPNLDRPGRWQVADGAIKGDAVKGGLLASERADYRDCHLRIRARRTGGGVPGIWCRLNLAHNGYLVAFSGREKATGNVFLSYKQGSEKYGDGIVLPEGEWFNLECIIQGKRVQVKVNGALTTDFIDQRQDAVSGAIVLEQPGGAVVEFRKIDIKELKAVPVPPDEPTGANDRTVKVWDAATGKELQRFQHNAHLRAALFTLDNRRVFFADSASGIDAWDLK